MSLATVKLTLRLRLAAALSAAIGLIAVTAAVGALFPSIGHSIGQLNLSAGVENLLGGADYGTASGWFQSEIGAIYGPLLIGGLAITGIVAATAGEEESRIMALVLAYPIGRANLVLSKAAAVGVVVVLIALATWVGLIIGVALAGGGVTIGHMSALAVQLAFFGAATGALAFAVAAGTGRGPLATGIAAGIAVGGWLVNSFAPLVSWLDWLKYLSPYYYYAGHSPLTQGIYIPGLIVLAAVTAVALAAGAFGIQRRDLRG